MNLLLFISKYWKQLISIVLIIMGYFYYNYAHNKINNLNLALVNSNTKVEQLKNNYELLKSQYQINSQITESVTLQLNDLQRRFTNDQVEIAENAPIIDRDNVITKQWLRYAFGYKTGVSAIASASRESDNQTVITGLVEPSAAASGINDYITACQQMKIKYDALIDFYTLNNALNDNPD